jgi:hypothetical protein
MRESERERERARESDSESEREREMREREREREEREIREREREMRENQAVECASDTKKRSMRRRLSLRPHTLVAEGLTCLPGRLPRTCVILF